MDNSTEFQKAIIEDDLEKVKTFVSNGLVNVNDRPYLLDAIRFPEIFEYLLTQGANPFQKSGYSTIYEQLLSRYSNPDLIPIIFKYFDPNHLLKDNHTAFEILIENSPLKLKDFIQQLISSRRASITPYVYSVILNYPIRLDIVKTILDAYGDLELTERQREELYNSVKYNDIYVLSYLIEKGLIPIERYLEDIFKAHHKTTIDWIQQNAIPYVRDYFQRQGLNEKQIQRQLEYYQELTPKAILPTTYRSGRGQTRLSRFLSRKPPRAKVSGQLEYRDLDAIAEPDLTRRQKLTIQILNDIEQNEHCFCLNYPTSIVTQLVGIPVTRYGKSVIQGYYGRGQVEDADFTWFYVEPDSRYLILSDKTAIARNKLSMVLFLQHQLDPEFKSQLIYNQMGFLDYDRLFGLPSNFSKVTSPKTLKFGTFYISSLNGVIPFYENTWNDLLSDTEIIYPNGNTNYFRNVNTGKYYFGEGAMDNLDPLLYELAIQSGLTCLVFTHQVGNSGRLVSECLDVRKRSDTFTKHIVKIIS